MPWIRRHPETEIQAATLLTSVLTAHPLRSDGTYDLAVSGLALSTCTCTLHNTIDNIPPVMIIPVYLKHQQLTNSDTGSPSEQH